MSVRGYGKSLISSNLFEDSHGAVFVRSNYLSIASDGYLRYGTSDPIRALASRYTVLAKQMWIPPLGGAWAVHEAREHRVNGALPARFQSRYRLHNPRTL